MNVDPTSDQFCDVVEWDSLTDEQKASGDWIELPAPDGKPRRARRDDAAQLRRVRRLFDRQELELGLLGSFDAVGRPR